MIKVITYGTFDLLHYGHIRLLERAKDLGDYLIVGVTSEDFDKSRGKINVQQSLMARVEAVRATGLADKIVIEEYEGQKIDDIRKYDVDIFAVGSDWIGHFDYLNEYCKVTYLKRTEGVSSTDLRSKEQKVKLGLVGEDSLLLKHLHESHFVNGADVVVAYTEETAIKTELEKEEIRLCDSYDEVLENCDAVYLVSVPEKHEEQIRKAIECGKHVLCESPIALKERTAKELFDLAEQNNLILMESIKTAYSTAYDRLLLLVKSGRIGQPVSIDSTCTSLREIPPSLKEKNLIWTGFEAWAPTVLLPIFQIFGYNDTDISFLSSFYDDDKHFDKFTQINVGYPNAVAIAKVGVGVKAEGELIISGTQGYIYVPAPWWKTDYFELRYENQTHNKRYFYQLDGEGIRNEIVVFVRSIFNKESLSIISKETTIKIADTFEKYINREKLREIAW